MGLSWQDLELGSEVVGLEGPPAKVVRIYVDAMVLETPAGRIYVPDSEFDGYTVLRGPRRISTETGYL